MPTLPPEGPARSPALHEARQMAVGFGIDVLRYDRARPDYPDALVARVVAGSPGLDVLDLGCGTGIAARQFQAAGCSVLGVDPDARMADIARARGLPVEVATFETWQAAGRSFDAVIAAQSWHWVDPAVGAAKAAEVLRPNGRLAIFGHAYEPPAEGWPSLSPPPSGKPCPTRRSLTCPLSDRSALTWLPTRPWANSSTKPDCSTTPSIGSSSGNGPTPATSGSTYSRPGGTSRRCPPTRSPTSSTQSRQPSTRTADTSR